MAGNPLRRSQASETAPKSNVTPITPAAVHPGLLKISGQRGIGTFTVRPEAISAWESDIAQRRSPSDPPLGVRMHLVNGAQVHLTHVSFDFATDVVREAYGAEFDLLFASGPGSKSSYVRTAHVLGWYEAGMNRTDFSLSGQQLPYAAVGAMTEAALAGPSETLVRVQPDAEYRSPAVHRSTLPPPMKYTVRASFDFAQLVIFEGAVYRRSTKVARSGSPAERPDDWFRMRDTLPGEEGVSIKEYRSWTAGN